MSGTDPAWPLRDEPARPSARRPPAAPGYASVARPTRRHPPSPEAVRDAQAAISARAELGADYGDEVAAGLADRVEELVAYRLADQHIDQRREDRVFADERLARGQRFALGIVSLGVGIPITAIGAMSVQPGLLGVAVAWAGIVGVNWAFAMGSRRRPRD